MPRKYYYLKYKAYLKCNNITVEYFNIIIITVVASHSYHYQLARERTEELPLLLCLHVIYNMLQKETHQVILLYNTQNYNLYKYKFEKKSQVLDIMK